MPASPLIAQIVVDDKFIDTATHRFEAVAPRMSRYFMAGPPRALKYIKETKVEFLAISDLCELVATGGFKAVIFHTLTYQSASILNSVSNSTTVVWLGWGADYYDALLSSYFPGGLHLPATAGIYDKLYTPSLCKMFVSKVKQRLRRKFFPVPPQHPLRLERVDYFCPVLELEHEMAVKANPWFRAHYIPWNYQSAVRHPHSPELDQKSNAGPNILVGNSATPTNNHVETFHWLAEQCDLHGRKIIVPLNYGEKEYGLKVQQIGTNLFGDAFMPLTEWMPLHQYFDLLKTCGYSVFGHLRQQAAGNVTQMMRQGSKVYMHSANPLYRHHTARGARMFSLDDCMASNLPLDFSPLTEEDVATNRSLAVQNSEFGPDFPRTRRLIELVLS